MNVLQIANGYFGSDLYDRLFDAIEKKGVASTVFVPIKKDKKIKHDNNILINGDGQRLLVEPCFNSVDRCLFFRKQKNIYNKIRARVDMNTIDCVHSHTLFSSGYAAMNIKRELGIPYITAVRNVDLNVFFRKVKHLRHIGVEVMKNAGKIIFLSNAYKNTIIDKYVPDENKKEISEKSVVIPNGISDFFLNNILENKEMNSDKIRIIYAGDINKNKNIIGTIRACKRLIEEGYDCVFTIVGNVTDRTSDKIYREDFIIHYPRCSQEELISHYRKNDIFVMPSHTETFGLVYAEAMSQGLPVIYTRGQGFDGQFRDGEVGYGVSDKDPGEICSRIKMIIKNYPKISENCLKNAERFDWNSIAGQYMSIYKQIVYNNDPDYI